MSLTCETCPSFLGADDARSFFADASITTPRCARFGYMLGVPLKGAGDSDPHPDAIAHFPTICKSHGKDRPLDPKFGQAYNPLLFDIDSKAVMAMTKDATVSTCFECSKAFYDNSRNTYGCSAKGVVITDASRGKLAAGCEWRENRHGSPWKTVPEADLMPPFTTAVSVTPRKPGSDPTPATAKPKAPAFALVTTPPTHRDSDAPVREEDQHKIRAYEKIAGPKDGRVYFLPIFRTEFFSEDRQQLIPTWGTGDVGDPALYVDYTNLAAKFMAVAYHLDFTLTLIGEPGSGKTEGARWLAARMNMPFIHLTFNEFSDPEETFGMMEAKDGSTYVSVGELPRNWTEAGLILSDEWNLGPDGIQQKYRAMNDASRIIKLYGRTYVRNADCYHLAAINPYYDVMNIGTKELASADVRRLSFHYMPVADDKQKKGIITTTLASVQPDETVPDSTIDTILKISKDLRQMVSDGKLPHHWPLSQDLKVAMLSIHFPLIDAYKAAYFDYVDPEIAAVAIAAIKTHIPYGM